MKKDALKKEDGASAKGVKDAAVLKEKPRLFTTGNMAVMGILTAAAYVLYMLPKMIPIFNLPFFPSWLDIQISDLPALLGGFAIGPWAGVIIIVIKCGLKMPFTSTSCVGELADILVGVAFVVPAALLYRRYKNRKSAVAGMCVGSASAVAVSVLANWLALIPFYALQFGNMDFDQGMSTIVNAVSALYSGVNADNFYAFYLPLAVVPFNLLRCIISSVITYFTYKPLSKYLHWEKKPEVKQSVGDVKSITEEQTADGVENYDSAAEKDSGAADRRS